MGKEITDSYQRRRKRLMNPLKRIAPPRIIHVCGSGTVMMVRMMLFKFAVPPPGLKSAMKNVHTPLAFPS